MDGRAQIGFTTVKATSACRAAAVVTGAAPNPTWAPPDRGHNTRSAHAVALAILSHQVPARRWHRTFPRA